MNLTPLNMYVLIKPEPHKQTEAAFLTPEKAQHDSKMGTVIDISATCPNDVKAGDTVIYLKVSGTAFGGNEIINYSDLLGVIKKEELTL